MGKEGAHSSGIQLASLSRKARILIVDSSVLMYDPHAIENFEDNVVVLTSKSLAELNEAANSESSRKSYPARNAISVLSEHEPEGNSKDLIPLGSGFLAIDNDGTDWEGLPSSVERAKTNTLIAVANHWSKKMTGHQYDGTKPRVSIVTQDVSLRFRARAGGISAEAYVHDRLVSRMSELYTGLTQVDLKEEEEALLNEFCQKGSLKIQQLPKSLNERTLLSNQFVRLITSKDQIGYGIYKADSGTLIHVKSQDKTKLKITPLNPEQACADNLLYDTGVILVTIVGVAGTGKTFLSLNAGLDQLRNGVYKKLIVFRPTTEAGKEIGFLKGDLTDKMAPWRVPIEASIRRIYSLEGKDKEASALYSEMVSEGTLEVRPTNYERGDSINNAFISVNALWTIPQCLKNRRVLLLSQSHAVIRLG